MIGTDGSLMRSQKPTLHQRDYSVDVGQKVLLGAGDVQSALLARSMPIAFARQTDIAIPAIGLDNTARLDTIGNESMQAVGGSVWHATHPNATQLAFVLFHCDHNQRLIPKCSTMTARSRPGRTIARLNLCSHDQAVR